VTTPTLTTQQIAAMPRVNLLPREISEGRKARQLRMALGGAVAASVVLVGAMYVMAHGSVGNAQGDLDSAQAQQSTLQAQVATYADDTALRAKRDDGVAMLQQGMANEVQWSRYLSDLSLRIPENVWVTNLSWTQNVDPVAPTSVPSDKVLTDDGLGTVTVEGVALTHDDVAAWLNSLAKEKGYVNPYFSQSQDAKIDDRVVENWTSTVQLSTDALSNRYTKPAGS
jgi:Tfp pilus assembly protein PilN